MSLRTIEANAIIHDRNDRGDPYFPDLVDQAEMRELEERLLKRAGGEDSE